MTVKELRALARIPGVGIRVFEDEIKDSLNEASRLEAELEMPTQPTT